MRLGQREALLEVGQVHRHRADRLVADGEPVRQVAHPVDQPDDRVVGEPRRPALGLQRRGGAGDLVAGDEEVAPRRVEPCPRAAELRGVVEHEGDRHRRVPRDAADLAGQRGEVARRGAGLDPRLGEAGQDVPVALVMEREPLDRVVAEEGGIAPGAEHAPERLGRRHELRRLAARQRVDVADVARQDELRAHRQPGLDVVEPAGQAPLRPRGGNVALNVHPHAPWPPPARTGPAASSTRVAPRVPPPAPSRAADAGGLARRSPRLLHAR